MGLLGAVAAALPADSFRVVEAKLVEALWTEEVRIAYQGKQFKLA